MIGFVGQHLLGHVGKMKTLNVVYTSRTRFLTKHSGIRKRLAGSIVPVAAGTQKGLTELNRT